MTAYRTMINDCEDFDGVVMVAQELEEAHRWRSARKEPPGECGNYITWDGYTVDSCSLFEDGWFREKAYEPHESIKVTHWMPLPDEPEHIYPSPRRRYER